MPQDQVVKIQTDEVGASGIEDLIMMFFGYNPGAICRLQDIATGIGMSDHGGHIGAALDMLRNSGLIKAHSVLVHCPQNGSKESTVYTATG